LTKAPATLNFVIAGLDPAIQGGRHGICDPWMPGSNPGMTSGR
jgi:hypothetical protein